MGETYKLDTPQVVVQNEEFFISDINAGIDSARVSVTIKEKSLGTTQMFTIEGPPALQLIATMNKGNFSGDNPSMARVTWNLLHQLFPDKIPAGSVEGTPFTPPQA